MLTSPLHRISVGALPNGGKERVMALKRGNLPRLIRLTIFVSLCSASLLTGWFLSAYLTAAQGRGKIIDKAFTRSAAVVEISEVRVSQKQVQLGKSFDEDDEWLNKVALKVKNISRKPIVYLQINLNFPETRGPASMMSYPLVFGQMPGSKFPQRKDPMFMLPGDTIEIPLDKEYTRIKSFIEHRQPITNICKTELEIGFVVFADKTAWAAGDFLRQDPNDADHYINIGDRPPN
jgi:hypothetical protein